MSENPLIYHGWQWPAWRASPAFGISFSSTVRQKDNQESRTTGAGRSYQYGSLLALDFLKSSCPGRVKVTDLPRPPFFAEKHTLS